jgi:hypothetical protein
MHSRKEASMAKSPEATITPTADPVPADGLDGVMAQSRLMTDLAGTFGAELLRFASRRMQAHADLYAGLVRCRTMQEMLDRQMDFVRQAGSDYAEEFGAMAQLAQQPKTPEVTDPARGSAD